MSKLQRIFNPVLRRLINSKSQLPGVTGFIASEEKPLIVSAPPGHQMQLHIRLIPVPVNQRQQIPINCVDDEEEWLDRKSIEHSYGKN